MTASDLCAGLGLGLFTRRFPLIVETLARLRSRSCIIDGEAVACDDNGVASFNLIRYRRHDDSTFLYAFDLIELNGDDLRRDPSVALRTSSVLIARFSHFDPEQTCRVPRRGRVCAEISPELLGTSATHRARL